MDDFDFEIFLKGRENISKLMDTIGLEAGNTIPKQYNNNVFWNYGHVIATVEILVYRLSHLPPRLPDAFIDEFKKGTRPQKQYTQQDLDRWKEYDNSQRIYLKEDFEKGVFTGFESYATSYGVKLESALQAFHFNKIHEGLHLGFMKAQSFVL